MNVPTEWKEYPLADLLVDIQPGFARRPSSGSKNTPQLRTNNISPEGRLDISELKYVPASRQEIDKYSLSKGDVIFNNTNSDIWVGKTAFIDRDINILYSNHITRLRVDTSKLDPQFFALYFQKLHRDGFFRSISTRWVNQSAVNTEALRRLTMKIPPLGLQRRIALVLKRTDGLRQKQEQARQLSNQVIQSVFLKMFGDPADNTKGFRIEKLGDFAEFAMGGTPNPNRPEYYGGEIKWLKGSDIEQEFIYDVPNRITEEGLLNSNAKIYGTGTVVVGRTGQGKTRGKTAILRVRAATNETMIAIVPKNALLPEYLQQNLKLRYRELRNFGGQNQRGGITQSHLRNLPLAIPPIELQRRFAELVGRVEKITKKQSESSCEIDELFNSFMSKAFKGDLLSEAKPDQRIDKSPLQSLSNSR